MASLPTSNSLFRNHIARVGEAPFSCYSEQQPAAKGTSCCWKCGCEPRLTAGSISSPEDPEVLSSWGSGLWRLLTCWGAGLPRGARMSTSGSSFADAFEECCTSLETKRTNQNKQTNKNRWAESHRPEKNKGHCAREQEHVTEQSPSTYPNA